MFILTPEFRYPIIISSLLFLTPFVLFLLGPIGSVSLKYVYDIMPSLGLSALFYLTVWITIIVIALLFSYTVSTAPSLNRTKKYALFFIAPLFLGPASIALIWKFIILGNSYRLISATSGIYRLIFPFLALLWAYVPLLLFFLIFTISPSSVKRQEYLKAVRGDSLSQFGIELFPLFKGTLMALSVFFSGWFFYETIVSQVLIRPSAGTNTELFSHAVSRIFHTISVANPHDGRAFLLISNAVAVLILIIINIVFLFLLHNLISYIANISIKRLGTINPNLTSNSVKHTEPRLGRLTPIILLVILFYSLIISTTITISIRMNYSAFAGAEDLLESLFLSVLSSLMVLMIASPIAWSMRKLAAMKYGDRIDIWKIAIVIMLPYFIPPIQYAMSGFSLMGYLGMQSNMSLAWIISHVFYGMPAGVLFLYIGFYRSDKNEMEFLNATLGDRIFKKLWLLISKHWPSFIVVFFFLLSFFWNEGALNKTFSDFIPNYSVLVEKALSGRSADFSVAAVYSLVSQLFMVLGILVASIAMRKYERN